MLQADQRRQAIREVNVGNITEQLQMDFLNKYEGVQSQIDQGIQFDKCIAVSTPHLGKVCMKIGD